MEIYHFQANLVSFCPNPYPDLVEFRNLFQSIERGRFSTKCTIFMGLALTVPELWAVKNLIPDPCKGRDSLPSPPLPYFSPNYLAA